VAKTNTPRDVVTTTVQSVLLQAYLEEKQHYVDGKRKCKSDKLERVEVAGKYSLQISTMMYQ